MSLWSVICRLSPVLRGVLMANKTLFWSFYVSFCTFYASLRLTRTVFTRLLKKANNHSSLILNHLYGLHSFTFYILIFDFPSHLPLMSLSASTYVPTRHLYNCKETFTDVMRALQIKLFMQNKAKFRKVKLNVNNLLTKDYDRMDTWSIGKKQSQTKPNKAKSKKAKMNVTSYITVAYENKPPIWAPKKQSQTSKRQKSMQPLLLQRIMKKTAISGPEKTNPNKPNQTQFKRQNYTGSENWCYKSTAAFPKNNVNRNCFLVKPLYQVRKTRLIQRVVFLKHRLLTHIRIAFRIVETKLKVYT